MTFSIYSTNVGYFWSHKHIQIGEKSQFCHSPPGERVKWGHITSNNDRLS